MRSTAGSARIAKGFRLMRMPSRLLRPIAPMPVNFSLPLPATRMFPTLRARTRSSSSDLIFRRLMRIWRAAAWPTPTRRSGSLRRTCLRLCRRRRSGHWLRHFCPIRFSASAFGLPICLQPCRLNVSRRLIGSALISAAGEFVAALKFNADRPEDRSTLANFYARQGRSAEAEAEYKAALRLSPQYTVAAINLADLYRQLNRDGDGESTLRLAIASSPQDAGLHHALGLTLNRLKRTDDSLAELGRAAELDSGRPRYAYVYAVGLHSAGRAGDAIAILKANLDKHPTDRDTLLALVTFNRDNGNIASALEYAERLAQLAPADRQVSELIDALKRQLKPAPQ